MRGMMVAADLMYLCRVGELWHCRCTLHDRGLVDYPSSDRRCSDGTRSGRASNAVDRCAKVQTNRWRSSSASFLFALPELFL